MRYGLLVKMLLGANLLACPADAQYEDIWVFGEKNAGIDFTGGAPVAIQTAITGFGEANASVCDAGGQLLFYTEGSFIWDRTGNLMPNGANLTPVPVTGSFSPTSSGAQGTVIVPAPGDPERYYVFSTADKGQGARYGELYYSTVDMTLNNGMGDVLPGSKGIFIDSFLSEKMTAVAGSRCNVWLLACSRSGAPYSRLKAYEITSGGVSSTPVISDLATAAGDEDIGVIAVSPDGRRLAISGYLPARGIFIYDFDPAAGTVKDPLHIAPGKECYGLSFSPDNSRLYAIIWGSTTGVYQYDLSSGQEAQINASGVFLGASQVSHLKTGPDGKIYFETGTTLLGAIEQPDLPGTASQYNANAVSLAPGTVMHTGLPNRIAVIRRDSLQHPRQQLVSCFAPQHTAVLQATDTAGWAYRWQDGQTGFRRTADSQGVYVVSYYTSPCAYHTDTFEVRLYTLPQVDSTGFSCPGASAGFIACSSMPGDTNTYIYSWYSGSGELIAAGENRDVRILTGLAPGIYRLRVETAAGCDTSLYFTIETLPVPDGLTAGNDTAILPFGKVQLHASGANSYEWSPARWLDDPRSSHPVATPRQSVVYTVTGANEYGCTASAEVRIRLMEQYYVPDAFSPNGDGRNDLFRIVNAGYHELLDFRVFDRWGAPVFQTGDGTKGWDGSYKGAPAPSGTYFYHIRLRSPDGAVDELKGDVTLVR